MAEQTAGAAIEVTEALEALIRRIIREEVRSELQARREQSVEISRSSNPAYQDACVIKAYANQTDAGYAEAQATFIQFERDHPRQHIPPKK